MVTMKCLLGQPMVFVNGYHWFVRLHLVGSTVYHWFVRLHLVADDGYGEMSAWATHGVCHRVITGLCGYIWWAQRLSLVCAATFGGPMMVTVKCLLGQLMVFVTGYHWFCAATIGGPLGHLTVSRLGNS